jgi:hypothetical protein
MMRGRINSQLSGITSAIVLAAARPALLLPHQALEILDEQNTTL